MNPETFIAPAMPRVVLWAISVALAAVAAYFGVLSYLSPDLLLNLSGSFIC